MSSDRLLLLDSRDDMATLSAPPAPRRWPVWLRGIVSVLVVLHVTAVFVAPASVPPSSQLAQDSWRVFGRYLQLFYLNHGYHYFAPEPAQSTLVAYSVEREDGTRVEGRFPNRDIYPRLLYHRHFMLTEFLAFPRSSEDQERLKRSYARHLCRKHQGTSASLSRISHYLPSMQAVREGVTLEHSESYDEQPLGIFRCDDL